MRKTMFAVLAAGLLSVAACGNRTAVPEFSTGMYVGELPCADCPGILTHLTFGKDSTAVLTSLYYDSDGTSFIEYGRWDRTKEGLVRLKVSSGDFYYRVKSDSTILMTDDQGNESATLADYYTLTRREPLEASSFAGRAVDGSGRVLEIVALSPDRVSVRIFSEQGCALQAEGSVVNDLVEVPLAQVRPELTSAMVVRPVAGEILNVSSSAHDDDDLRAFCPDGKTLAGDYRRDADENIDIR